jgi:hypothetical protein
MLQYIYDVVPTSQETKLITKVISLTKKDPGRYHQKTAALLHLKTT